MGNQGDRAMPSARAAGPSDLSRAGASSQSGIPIAGWTLYADRAPEREGVFEWRVPSRAVKGVVLQFCAHMRERGAGYKKAISPIFDHWDGRRLHVPEGTQWRETGQCANLKWHSYGPISVAGLDVAPCLFCGSPHALEGVERALGGGTVLCADPHRLNSFWLDGCAWAKTPHLGNPRELVEAWNARHAQSPTPSQRGQS